MNKHKKLSSHHDNDLMQMGGILCEETLLSMN
jgi:hypothetical protein